MIAVKNPENEKTFESLNRSGCDYKATECRNGGSLRNFLWGNFWVQRILRVLGEIFLWDTFLGFEMFEQFLESVSKEFD